MDRYFVARSERGEFVGLKTAAEIIDGFQNGDLPRDYVAAKAGTYSYADAIKFGESLEWVTVSVLAASAVETPSVAAEEIIHAGSDRASGPVLARYHDAYRVGFVLVGLGGAIKIVGAVVGGIMAVTWLGYADGVVGVLAGLFVAVIVGVLYWVVGVVVSAQGQILRATLDNAVASSPFLTDVERADTMGLPRSVAKGI